MTVFFWTGVAGAVTLDLVVPFFASAPGFRLVAEGPIMHHRGSGYFCLISALDTKHGSTIQPFAYLQLVFASNIGIIIVDEQVDQALNIRGLMIVGSGLFALNLERHDKLLKAHRY